MDIEELKHLATKKYPKGTVVNSLVSGYTDLIIEGDVYTCGTEIWVPCTEFNALLYRKGIWADIVSSPSKCIDMFNEGDYIVCLSVKESRITTPKKKSININFNL